MTAFLSIYVNKVDKKGRVSVPAAYRAALAGGSYQGIIAYPSLTGPAIEAFSRDTLEQLNTTRLNRSLDGGDFAQALTGGDTLIETIMALVCEMPFDGEGRVLLPASLSAHAGIADKATFVGRGNRFQIWSPDTFARHHDDAVTELRTRLDGERRT